MWDALRLDLRQSLRGLRRSPGFTLVVILTFALAIGATTTVASLLNALMLRTIPVVDPDRLVSLSAIDVRTNLPGSLYADAFVAYRAAQRSLSAIAMYSTALFRVETRNATADGMVEGVTAEYFGLVGARLAAGRFLTERDSTDEPVAVISDRFRLRLFGVAAAIGETVKMDGTPVTIVGVTAPGFYGLQFDGGTDVFVPIAVSRLLSGDARPLRASYFVGRLRPGLTLDRARAEIRTLWPAIAGATAPSSLSAAEREAWRSRRIELERLATGFSGLRMQYGSSLLVLVAMAGVLLAIGCVNLAGLLLARSLARRADVALRVAVGASRGRLVQQILIDGVLLALCGLAASLPFAWWTIRWFTAAATIARGTPMLQRLTPDARALGIVTLITLLMGLAIGVLPAWRAARATTDGLRPGRAIAGTLGRPGRLLLVAQVALSMVLLVGAGLFTHTLSRLRANDGSLSARRIAWTRLAPAPGDREPMGRAYLQAVVRQLERLHGVDAAALSVWYPAIVGFPSQLPTDRYSRPEALPSTEVAALTEFVSPGFFNTFDIPRLRGRDFTWADDEGAPQVAMVSERVAHALFSDNDVIHRRLRMSSGQTVKELEIVGVVAGAAIGKIRDPNQPVVFRPILQEATQARFPLASVRVAGDLRTVRDGYARAVESQGRHIVRAVFTVDQWVDHTLLQERLTAGLSTFAGALAVVLACIGVYGMVAYSVTSRIRELGVRMALGATRATVVRMVVREGLIVAIPGVLIGVPCALAAARLVRSQLYGIGPSDPSTLIGASIVFVLTGLIASVVPAVRASQIDPMEALRHD